VNCSERDRLDAEVAQATLEWTALDQTPLPDVSIPGGLTEAEILRDEEKARGKSLTEHGQHIRGIAERIAAVSQFRFRCSQNQARISRALCAKPSYFCE
jgi:hypothetical protein